MSIREESKKSSKGKDKSAPAEENVFNKEMSLVDAVNWIGNTYPEPIGDYISHYGKVGFGGTGHSEDGKLFENHKASAAFGEMMPDGVEEFAQLLDVRRQGSTTLFDLGAGRNKLLMQMFCRFPNLKRLVGVELCPRKARQSREAFKNLVAKSDGKLQEVPTDKAKTLIVSTANRKTTRASIATERTIEIREGSLFEASDVKNADVVIMETKFPAGANEQLCELLLSMKKGVRIVTYDDDFPARFSACRKAFPFRRTAYKGCASSWCDRGDEHYFSFYEKTE